METKYDVFISYCRKDYVKDDNVIPGNPISAIMEFLDKNHLKYWLDKEGLYSGEEFAEKISKAIESSKMFVFISSKNSNVSEYTCGEILKAKKADKLIIPILIDKSDYNKKFEILLLPLNHIDYVEQPKTPLPELLRTILNEKERLEIIEAQKKQILLKKQEETLKETVKLEIKQKTKDFLALIGQQDFILKELYTKNKLIGNTFKRCPICNTESAIQSQYCEQCGWSYHRLYGLVDHETILHDETQLKLCKDIWKDHKESNRKEEENQKLRNDNSSLRQEIESLKQQLEEEKKAAAAAAIQREEEDIKRREIENRDLLRYKDENGKFGYKDPETGEVIIPGKWECAGTFSEGLAAIKDVNNKWGFIDKKGNVTIPCSWLSAGPFSEGFASVQAKNGRWGYIDKTGRTVIPCSWENVRPFSGGLAEVRDEYFCHKIDKTGKIVR